MGGFVRIPLGRSQALSSAVISDHPPSKIGADVHFEGSWFTTTALEVEGHIQGAVAQLPGSSLCVRIGQHATADALVRADHVLVDGRFQGRVDGINGLVQVGPSGTFIGEVRGSTVVSSGGVVDATVISTSRT